MKGILLNLNEKQHEAERVAKEQAIRDEQMREEGRLEARSKQFLQFDELEGSLAYTPLGNSESPTRRSHVEGLVVGGGAIPSRSHQDLLREKRAMGIPSSAEAVVDLLSEHPGRRSLTPQAMILRAVDSEVQSAEELFAHMKKLRKDLKSRMVFQWSLYM
jgi:hypothetical protein